MQGLRFLFLGLAAALLLAIGLGDWRARLPAYMGERPADASVAVLAEIGAAPEFRTFFRNLRVAFPRDWQRMVARAAERRRLTGQAETPEAFLIDALGKLRRGRGILAAKASDAALVHLFEIRARLLQALAAAGPKLCTDFLYGSGPGPFAAFARENRALVGEMAEAALDAILDGETSRISRAAPSEATLVKIEDELGHRGFGRPEIAALLDGRTGDPPVPDARLCAAALAYLDVVHAMPDDRRVPIYALSVELMARS